MIKNKKFLAFSILFSAISVISVTTSCIQNKNVSEYEYSEYDPGNNGDVSNVVIVNPDSSSDTTPKEIKTEAKVQNDVLFLSITENNDNPQEGYKFNKYRQNIFNIINSEPKSKNVKTIEVINKNVNENKPELKMELQFGKIVKIYDYSNPKQTFIYKNINYRNNLIVEYRKVAYAQQFNSEDDKYGILSADYITNDDTQLSLDEKEWNGNAVKRQINDDGIVISDAQYKYKDNIGKTIEEAKVWTGVAEVRYLPKKWRTYDSKDSSKIIEEHYFIGKFKAIANPNDPAITNIGVDPIDSVYYDDKDASTGIEKIYWKNVKTVTWNEDLTTKTESEALKVYRRTQYANLDNLGKKISQVDNWSVTSKVFFDENGNTNASTNYFRSEEEPGTSDAGATKYGLRWQNQINQYIPSPVSWTDYDEYNRVLTRADYQSTSSPNRGLDINNAVAWQNEATVNIYEGTHLVKTAKLTYFYARDFFDKTIVNGKPNQQLKDIEISTKPKSISKTYYNPDTQQEEKHNISTYPYTKLTESEFDEQNREVTKYIYEGYPVTVQFGAVSGLTLAMTWKKNSYEFNEVGKLISQKSYNSERNHEIIDPKGVELTKWTIKNDYVYDADGKLIEQTRYDTDDNSSIKNDDRFKTHTINQETKLTRDYPNSTVEEDNLSSGRLAFYSTNNIDYGILYASKTGAGNQITLSDMVLDTTTNTWTKLNKSQEKVLNRVNFYERQQKAVDFIDAFKTTYKTETQKEYDSSSEAEIVEYLRPKKTDYTDAYNFFKEIIKNTEYIQLKNSNESRNFANVVINVGYKANIIWSNDDINIPGVTKLELLFEVNTKTSIESQSKFIYVIPHMNIAIDYNNFNIWRQFSKIKRFTLEGNNRDESNNLIRENYEIEYKITYNAADNYAGENLVETVNIDPEKWAIIEFSYVDKLSHRTEKKTYARAQMSDKTMTIAQVVEDYKTQLTSSPAFALN